MKTLRWLVRRELWEHKGMFVWAPLVMGAVLIVLVSLPGAHFSVTVNGHEDPNPAARAAMMLSTGYLGAAVPLFAMLAIVALFYCVGALYDDRRDRSILFWKSLPVSDRATVLSKLVTVLGVAPIVTIVVATVTAFVVLLIIGGTLAAKGIPVLGVVLATPDVWIAPLMLAGLLPVYIVWALPAVGWLLMVSAWARSKAFLWAVGVPIFAMIVVKWAKLMLGPDWQGDWLIRNVFARAFVGLAPGNWFLFAPVTTAQLATQDGPHPTVGVSAIFVESWKTLATVSPWIAAAAGIGMLAVAVWLRRTRSER